MRAVHGIDRIISYVRFCALIEGHDDIRSQAFLDLDGFLRGKPVKKPSIWLFKVHAILIYFAVIRKRKHLETTGIG